MSRSRPLENQGGHARIGVNEFYQKGCQEQTSDTTGGERFSRDPARGNQASLTKFVLYPFGSVSFGEFVVPSSLREQQANGDSKSTMVLSEARGL